MSRARKFADLAGSADAGGLTGRNLIINGAMQVAQRGTSFSSITASVYPVDRFFVKDTNAASGQATVSQSTTAPDDFKYALKVDVTSADTSLAANDQYKIEYRAEGQDVAHLNWGTSAAKTVTLSFWIRSNKTGNTQVAVVNGDNNRSYVAPFTIGASNTWERKELTIDGDTGGTWLTSNDVGLRLRWGSFGSGYQTSSVDQWLGNQKMSRDDSPINFFDSTDNELYLTGVQLEVGEQATPFEHRSFHEQRLACYRYFFQFGSDGSTGVSGTNNNCHISYAYVKSNTAAEAWVSPPLPMRVQPTVTVSATGDVACHLPGFVRNAATALTTQDNLSGFNAVCLNVTYGSNANFTNGKVSSFEFTGSGGKFLRMDAEL